MTNKMFKIWPANYRSCIGIEFQVKRDMDLSAFELNLHFGSVKCHAVFSSYISMEYSFETVASHWTRSENVYVPHELIQMISDFANVHGGYTKHQSIRLDRDYLHRHKESFSSKQHPIIRLRANRMLYKLAFIISDNFYCTEYISEKDKHTIDANLAHIRFDMMSRGEINNRKSKREPIGLTKYSTVDWFPTIAFVKV